jgi:hypothetical protein
MKRVRHIIKCILYLLIPGFLFYSCREDCYPNTEHYFETRFIKGGKTIDPGYEKVYATGGKGNIPLQETRYGEHFYCLPIPLGKDEVTYYFEKIGIKDSIDIYYSRTEEYQSAKCGKVIKYSSPEVISSTFNNIVPVIINENRADYDKFNITVTL